MHKLDKTKHSKSLIWIGYADTHAHKKEKVLFFPTYTQIEVVQRHVNVNVHFSQTLKYSAKKKILL
jgi:hypothetical protein